MGVVLPVIREIQVLENKIEDAYEPKRPWNPDKEEEVKFCVAYAEWENKISCLEGLFLCRSGQRPTTKVAGLRLGTTEVVTARA